MIVISINYVDIEQILSLFNIYIYMCSLISGKHFSWNLFKFKDEHMACLSLFFSHSCYEAIRSVDIFAGWMEVDMEIYNFKPLAVFALRSTDL